jgi:menaquinone-dependent protoporphyrinogen IX oxidase
MLVTYGSKLRGTAGLAQMVGDALRRHGCEVSVLPVRSVASVAGFDGVMPAAPR